jgi:hypothetical protein
MKKHHLRSTMAALCLICMIGCIARYFQVKYFLDEYEPIQITQQEITDYPDTHFIQGLTCVSYANAYCNTAALEMIGLQQGIDKTVHYYNWLTAFTYGAGTFLPDYLARYLPYTDPETGNKIAAPYLGLKRNYFVTKNKDLYIKALKSYLSQNYPLRVALDAGVYRNLGAAYPHAILVVGYTDSQVYYYETGGDIDRRIPDHPGETMTWETLIDSVETLDSFFAYPWTYNFTVFTKGTTETDMVKVWERNAYNIIGYDYTSIAYGSMAILRLVEAVQDRDLTDSDKDRLRSILEMSVYTRADNSDFIKENFQDEQLRQAADLLQEASDTYASLSVDDQPGLVAGLQKCAELEEEIGTVMNTYCTFMNNK